MWSVFGHINKTPILKKKGINSVFHILIQVEFKKIFFVCKLQLSALSCFIHL